MSSWSCRRGTLDVSHKISLPHWKETEQEEAPMKDKYWVVTGKQLVKNTVIDQRPKYYHKPQHTSDIVTHIWRETKGKLTFTHSSFGCYLPQSLTVQCCSDRMNEEINTSLNFTLA